MAKTLINAYVLLNAVDLSDHVKSITFPRGGAALDSTAMGDTTTLYTPGLLSYGFDIEFFQDFASGKVDATLSPLVGAAAFAFEIRGVNAAVSPTNPKWTGTVILSEYSPVSGTVGELLMASAKFMPATAVTRGTS